MDDGNGAAPYAPQEHDPFGLRARARLAAEARAQRASQLELELEVDERVHAAHADAASSVVQRIKLANRGIQAWRDLRLRVRTEPDHGAEFVRHLERLEPGEVWIADQVRLALDAERLRRLEERERLVVAAEILEGDEVLRRVEREVELLGLHEWPGAETSPELLAAFVSPGDASLEPLQREVVEALAAHPDADRAARARAALSAVWDAFARRGLTFATPPVDFATAGQRVRSPERVLAGGVATCLDLCAAMGALLERIGLVPVLVVCRTRTLLGAWLEPGSFDVPVLEDPRALTRRLQAELVAVFDPVGLTDRPPSGFDEAVAAALARLEKDEAFVCAVDVAAARRRLIEPLVPLGASATERCFDDERASQANDRDPVDARLDAWKRRLLDLSLNNRFLNYRDTKRSLELAPVPLEALESALARGRSLSLVPDARRGLGGRDAERRAEEVAAELAADKLLSDAEAADHEERLVEIRRAARHSLEESGANTLFVALGFLEWRDPERPSRVLRAPLLLRPLELERGANNRGWRLVAADDDCRANDALLEKLAAEFGLDPAPFAELPMGGEGVDVHEWLVRWRRAIVEFEDWRIDERATVGLFSFTKFLMWRDLDRQREALAETRVTRFLIERPDEPFEIAPPPLEPRPPSRTWIPLDADSSQLAAIEEAVAGRSFVLEGPPGTGKSQTITNLVARALAAGQRVLFVAEKRAALEVVQRRLEQIGLGPFCLELHSNKIAKRAVVEQLGRALEERDLSVPGDLGRRGAELDRLTRELDAHVEALHRTHAIDRTLYQQLARACELVEVPRVELGIEDPLVLTAADAEHLSERSRGLARAAALVEPGPDHPLDAVRATDPSELRGPELAEQVAKLETSVDALRAAWRPVAEVLVSDPPDDPCRRQLLAVRVLAGALREAPEELVQLLRGAELQLLSRTRERTFELAQDHAARRDALLGRWSTSFLDADLEDLQQQVARLREKGFFGRFLGKRKLDARLEPLRRSTDPPDLGRLWDELREARTLISMREELERSEWGRVLGPDWFESRDSIESAGRALEATGDLLEGLRDLDPGVEQGAANERLAAALESDGADLRGRLDEASSKLDRFEADLQPVASTLELDRERLHGAENERPLLERLTLLARTFEELGPRIRDWCLWQTTRRGTLDSVLAPLVEALDEGSLPAERVPEAVEGAFVRSWVDAAVAAEPALRRFHGLEHDQLLERFRALDRDWHLLVQRAVAQRIDAAIPRPGSATSESSELGVLLRELRKKRGHLPVRRLLERLPTLIQRLAPCVLMSPLSAAQFLSAGLDRFDLVVFDEASQIPAWDGVGAMARGRSVIVVGDSKQLPPTSFFQVTTDEDPDEEDLEELESLLDECVACGLPRRSLDWHYRSRHESLIAFSNAHYYGGRLETFPAPERELGPRGLEWRRVEDATYDRAKSRTNRVEAEALVECALDVLRGGDDAPSLGIVTFSQAQQVLVEELLERALAKEPEAVQRAAGGGDEPLFVKNLENVQGDERDVILLGVGYGPDANGRFAMHFGPLNRQGGERRLNVAVTRARERLVAFSSFAPEAIDLRRTEAVGVRHLRNFLEFAAERGGGLTVDAGEAPAETQRLDEAASDGFVARLCMALEERGHTVQRRVGTSGFRIDLVVRDRTGRSLALLLDGDGYARSRSARDRDRIRIAVLEGLGWKVANVWALDLWSDLDGTVARIERALVSDATESESSAETPEPTSDDENTIAAEAVEDGESEAAVDDAEVAGDGPPSSPFDLPLETGLQRPDLRPSSGPAPYLRARPKSRADLAGAFHEDEETPAVAAVLLEVIADEGPIATELAFRRVLDTYGFKRASAKLFARLTAVLDALPADRCPRRVGDILWPVDRDPAEHAGFRGLEPDGETPRSAEELPLEEVANAARWVLDQNLSMPRSDLARETARLFGYARVGSQLELRMEAGIELLERSGRCRTDGDRVLV